MNEAQKAFLEAVYLVLAAKESSLPDAVAMLLSGGAKIEHGEYGPYLDIHLVEGAATGAANELVEKLGIDTSDPWEAELLPYHHVVAEYGVGHQEYWIKTVFQFLSDEGQALLEKRNREAAGETGSLNN